MEKHKGMYLLKKMSKHFKDEKQWIFYTGKI